MFNNNLANIRFLFVSQKLHYTNVITSIIFISCFLLNEHTNAQQGEISLPVGLNFKVYKTLPQVIMPPLDSSVLWQDQGQDQKIKTPVGYNFKTAFSPENSGEWKSYSKDYKTWILKIRTPDAYGIALVLTGLKLMPGEKLYIYNLNGMHGPFDESNAPASGILPMNYIKGDELIVELNVPISHTETGNFVIETVSHAFVNIFKPEFHLPAEDNTRVMQSDACYPCLEGNFWEQDKRSVVKLLIFQGNSTKMCTGTLVNNTAQDKKPYILTAQHCITGQTDADLSVFTFQYEDSNCDGIVKVQNRTFIGAQYRASRYENDFSIVELNDHVPMGFHPYFAGWDISDTYVDQVSCIHHPLAGVKKISLQNGAVAVSDFIEDNQPQRATNAFWHVTKWDVGITEGGSSGGPLFNENHHIIGTLTGGNSACGYPYDDYFERISKSWTPVSDTDQQLKYWLDPLSSGVNSLNGVDPFEGMNPQCDTVSNIIPGELTDLLPYTPGTGYFGGCNSDNITTYAEEFFTADSTLLTGATIYVGSINTEAEGGILVTVNAEDDGMPGAVLYEAYFPYSKLKLYFDYLEFYPYAKVKGKFFISYTLSCSSEDSFSPELALWRNPSGNTAWMKLTSGWTPMNKVNPEGLGSSFYIEPILCTNTIQPVTDEPHTIILYPNPATTFLICHISFDQGKEFGLEIYDSEGRLQTVDYKTYDNNLVINIPQLSNGLYIVRVLTCERVYTGKFIKLQ